MAVVGLAARTLDQRAAAINILALTGAALLVADPLLAADTGFWLTTAATAGLVVGLGDADPRALLVAAAGPRAGADLGVGGAGPAADRRAGLRAGDPGRRAAQRGGDSGDGGGADGRRRRPSPAISAPRGCIAPAGIALRAGAGLVTESARVVEWLPLLSWRVPPPHLAVVGAYYAALGVWIWARVPGRGRSAGAAAAGARCPRRWCWQCGLRWRRRAWWPGAGRYLDVTTLDVGQGDAIVIRFPNGATMLVDAGGRSSGSFDIGARVVGPALRARGIRRLDYLVVTHADADHIGGAVSVVEEFTPVEVWTGVPVAGDAATRGAASRRRRGRRPPGARCSAATGSRSARSRSACCTRRRPTGSASASATTTPWCWR